MVVILIDVYGRTLLQGYHRSGKTGKSQRICTVCATWI